MQTANSLACGHGRLGDYDVTVCPVHPATNAPKQNPLLASNESNDSNESSEWNMENVPWWERVPREPEKPPTWSWLGVWTIEQPVLSQCDTTLVLKPALGPPAGRRVAGFYP